MSKHRTASRGSVVESQILERRQMLSAAMDGRDGFRPLASQASGLFVDESAMANRRNLPASLGESRFSLSKVSSRRADAQPAGLSGREMPAPKVRGGSIQLIPKGPEAGGMLDVSGTTGPDLIIIEVVGDDLQITVNEFVDLWPDSTIGSIEVNAFDGADSIFVQSNSDNPTFIRSQQGLDQVFLGSVAGDIDLITSSVVVEGGPPGDGADLVIYDDLNTFSDPYTITSTTLARAFFGGVTFSELTSLELRCQGADSVINVESTPACPTFVYGEGGNDVCNLTELSGNLEDLNGPFVFDGGLDADVMNLYDLNNTFDDAWTIDGATISRPFVDPIVCDADIVSVVMGTGNNPIGVSSLSLQSLFVSGSAGNDTMQVNGLATGSMLTFFGDAGNDNMDLEETSSGSSVVFHGDADADGMRIAFGTGDLGNVAGSVEFNGGAGMNEVSLWDDLNSGASNYTIESTTLVRSEGFGGLTYSNVNNLTLNAQQGDNEIDVNSVLPGTNIGILGNEGDDNVYVGLPTGDLTAIQFTVNVDGGLGNDGIYFYDDLRTEDLSYSLSDAVLTGDGFPIQSFSEVELAQLMTGGGANTINVRNFNPILQAIYAGGGDDIINVTETAVPVQINGGAGLDQFNIGTIVESEGDSSAQAVAVASNGEADELSSVSILAGCMLSIADDHTLTSTGEAVIGTLSFGLSSTYIAVAAPVPMTPETGLNLIIAGYAGGSWTGAGGSFSSHASAATTIGDGIGYARASDLAVETFNDVDVGADDLIFTQTLYADANLDYMVDFDDLLKVAQRYNTASNFWFDGDFTYDQIVDFNDLLRVAQNYGTSTLFSTRRIASIVDSVLKDA